MYFERHIALKVLFLQFYIPSSGFKTPLDLYTLARGLGLNNIEHR